jgi:galactokinase
MSDNYSTLIVQFKTIYHKSPTHISVAPGRVNLIGEFTDYNLGYVLPCALEFSTKVLFAANQSSVVNVHSTAYPNEKEQFDLSQPLTQGKSQWGNYIRAVAFVLTRQGYKLSGLNILIDSNVPQGAGLSSSAALEVSIAGAFNKACDLGLTNEEIAVIGQAAENDFMNCNCGIMDQLISAQGQASHAVLIDCDDLSTEAVPIPSDLSLVIVNSNYPRKLVDSEYNQRRVDCENAANKMGISSLREANLTLLNQCIEHLTNNELKRARHVITENKRVLDTVKALKENDMPQLIELLAASHHSLKYDFEVTVAPTDGLVDIIAKALGKKGAVRMTGGGFGGAVVCLCREQEIPLVKAAVKKHYHKQFGLHADVYVCQAGKGLTTIPLQ